MVQSTPPCSLCEDRLYSPIIFPLTILSLDVRLFEKRLVILLRTKCCISEKNNQLFKKATCNWPGRRCVDLVAYQLYTLFCSPPTLWYIIWVYILSTESIAAHSSHKVSNSRNRNCFESAYIKIHTHIQTWAGNSVKRLQQMATLKRWKCLGYGKYSLEINEYNTRNGLSTFVKPEQRAQEFPKDGGPFRWWAPEARWNWTETKVLRLASGEEEERAGP